MYNPVATYRIQFSKEFTFKDFEKIIPYLQKLGIKTIYASPIFSATPGSTHGYDGINPQEINPEIGDLEILERIHHQLEDAGIGWLQDIVPNHLAFHPGNKWLMDVLKKGKASAYASHFDILWQDGEKLMVPFLGAPLDEVLEQKELEVVVDKDELFLKYFDALYPLADGSNDATKTPQEIVREANDNPEALKEILDLQHYRLCYWGETDNHINYRRFFTVNGLICLNIQEPKVFEDVHQTVKQCLDKGLFNGLRIDHIDGLYDPGKYLQQLRALSGNGTYTVIEKILEPGEALPPGWPVQGSTGYDFLAMVHNLMNNAGNERILTRYYEQLVGKGAAVQEQIYEKKAHILQAHMQGELENLYQLFISSELAAAPDPNLKEAIATFLVHCPVYRYYGNSFPLGKEETEQIIKIFTSIKERNPGLANAIDLLQEAWIEKPKTANADYNAKALHFYQRCMQFTGPLMAKGVEDTLMYSYNRFIGTNDVGNSPEVFGIPVIEFHKNMIGRQRNWPMTMNTTATHDTKRGEDARARLSVLTDLGDEWISNVKSWHQLNEDSGKKYLPGANDAYFIYQTLVATYPFTEEETKAYPARISEYLTKALREAKVHTDWTKPDEIYERGAINFALDLLDDAHPFKQIFLNFQQSIVDFGIINSLTQVVLKFTCPGIADTYQGTELWDLSLVDPDNRRPVNYELRSNMLDQITDATTWTDLWGDRTSGAIKLWLVKKLIQICGENQALFNNGQYVPLRMTGRYKDYAIAFARRQGKDWILVAVPLHTAALCRKQSRDPLAIDWKDTAIILPPEAPHEWQNITVQHSNQKFSGTVLLNDIFQTFPIALLHSAAPQTERSAGVLMAVTSLPSPYGIGDFGAEAYAFVSTLARSGQSYWQLLPLNPTSAESGYSPYSSVSTMAGNTLLISPDQLVQAGLLMQEEAARYQLPQTDIVDYAAAERRKEELLRIAYQRYKSGHFNDLQSGLEAFAEREAFWLNDYAMYLIVKKAQNGKPWYEWPAAYKKRDTETLQKLLNDHQEEVAEIIWRQFIFSEQWQALKAYCNNLGIELMGDLPFYASYDSADVWTNPDIFSLDEDGNMTGIAGVPPDYFSKTGQLWGMPTYNWQRLQEQQYQWWITRLRKNLELYNVLRIDHFRALAGYWEVPAGELTAVNGQWLPGPGTDFFSAVHEAFGSLPFIAEDLGDNMDDVYKLRDEVQLPGMKVMQFAFGDNMPASVDAPHNYNSKNFVAYTGTHDNNTTLGWFRQDTMKEDRKRLEQYVGHKVTEKNVTETLARLAYGSVAKMAILPMADVLNLDEKARMNMPSSASGNWAWRLLPGQFSKKCEKWLLDLVRFYNRL